MSDELPEILYNLKKNRYKVKTLSTFKTDNYTLFNVDLSELKLKLSHNTPVVWITKEKAKYISPEQLVDDLNNLGHSNHWKDRVRIVLLDADGTKFKQQTIGHHLEATVIFDRDDQQAISRSLPLPRTMLDIICKQIPLSNLSPYTYGASVEGSRFFGRHAEISRIIHYPETNFAIISERRIGKTSLIQEIKRRLLERDEDDSAVIYYDCSVIKSLEQFVEAIVGEVNIKEYSKLYRRGNHSQFLRILKNTAKSRHKKITFLLDEFDSLISNLRKTSNKTIKTNNNPRHTAEEIDLLSLIRASANSGYCRYIFAGGMLLRGEITHRESPLYHGIEIIELKPFIVKETEEIVFRPMRSLGIRFENEKNIVADIQANTFGYPLFVQFCCVELVNQLDKERQQDPVKQLLIDKSNIEKINNNPNFWRFITETFRDNVGDLEQAIVYAIIDSYGVKTRPLPLTTIAEVLLEHGLKLSVDEIENACQNLITSAILSQNERGYFFSISIFPEALLKRYGSPKYLLQEKIEILK